LARLSLNAKGKAWFSLGSWNDVALIDHRSGRRLQARWALIRASLHSAVADQPRRTTQGALMANL